jgi:hypothetical protein
MAGTSAERKRVQKFGKLEDGLRTASDWYLWGPYLGVVADLICRRYGDVEPTGDVIYRMIGLPHT